MNGPGNLRYCANCGARLARDNRLTQCTPCQKKAHDLALGPPEVPAEFWTTSFMRDALAAWHIGWVVRAYRHHRFHGSRPLSQGVVAGWLGLTQTQLSRIEGGPPVKDLDKLTRWARTLNIPAHLLWFKLPEGRGYTAPPAHERTSSALPPLPLASPSSLAWASLLTGDSDAAAMQAFRAADRQVGGGHLYATAVGYLHTSIAPRLFGAAGAPNEPGIFAAAGALTEMAGWMAHDAGHDATAHNHFRRSLNLATAANDAELSAHILASMSHLALHQHESEQAIRLARNGQTVLSDGPSNPDLTARLLAMEARGLASLPQPETAVCGSVLLRAEQVLDLQRSTPPSPWVSQFDEGSLANEAARAYRQLGQLDPAARHARRIIEIRGDDHARSRAFGQLLLANVLIAQGELEEACALGRQSLEATVSLSSYLVIEQLRELAQLLAPYQANLTVAEFVGHLHETLRERLWLYSWLPIERPPNAAPTETSQ